MLKNLSTERKIIATFGGALAVLCIISLVSVASIANLLKAWQLVAHTHDVLETINTLQADVIKLADAARWFTTTPDDDNFDHWQRQEKNVAADIETLRGLTNDSVQQAHLTELANSLNQLIQPTKRNTSPALLQQIWRLGALRPSVNMILAMDNDERDRLKQRDAQTRATATSALLAIASAGGVAVILITISVVLIIRDLKHRRRAEAELQRARQAAEAASVAKSSFLANMSHELRTPLTAILGYTDLLLAPTSERERNRYLVTMRRSGEHLLTIINDVLDLSKIEAGRMEVEFVDCRLVDVLADVDSLMRPRASAKGIDFAVDYSSSVPDRILTDPTRLRQVLVNLVSNAVKFTDQGSVRLIIRYEVGASAAHLIIEVVDTGIGITPDQRRALFEPFTQADVTTTRRYGGTGLGLSICRRLAKILGGELSVTSEVARGSTFRLTLPVSAIDGASMLAPGEIQRFLAATRPLVELPNKIAARVLLAEDGPEARDVISLHLERAGCEVLTANDGQAAVQQALHAANDGAPFDVILMDMQMPVMDGYTATSRLRGAGYKAPIVALTANAMKEDRERCIQAGCDEYAVKPIDVPSLLALIEKFAGKKTLNHRAVSPTLLDDPVLLALTRKFCDSTGPALDAMHAHFEARQFKELAAAAHKLAGAGGSYGFQDITREAKALERLAQIPASYAELQRQLDRLAATCDAARNALATASA